MQWGQWEGSGCKTRFLFSNKKFVNVCNRGNNGRGEGGDAKQDFYLQIKSMHYTYCNKDNVRGGCIEKQNYHLHKKCAPHVFNKNYPHHFDCESLLCYQLKCPLIGSKQREIG